MFSTLFGIASSLFGTTVSKVISWSSMLWVKIAVTVLLVLAIFFAGYHLRSLSAAKDLAEQELHYETQLSDIQVGLQKAKVDVLESVRIIEANHNKEIDRISQQYETRLKAVQNERNNFGIAIGADGLWIDIQIATCRKYSTGIDAGSGIGNGEARCRLSEKAARDLGTLAYEADQVTIQLGAAQEVIIEDRK